MFGLQEILIIIAIILGILFIPRMVYKRPPPSKPQVKVNLSGKLRVALAVSALYPAIAAAYLQPWQKDKVLFLYIGIGPVLLGWLFYWVVLGYKKKQG